MHQISTSNVTVSRVLEARPLVFVEGPSERFVAAASNVVLNARVEIPDCAVSSVNEQVMRLWELMCANNSFFFFIFFNSFFGVALVMDLNCAAT